MVLDRDRMAGYQRDRRAKLKGSPLDDKIRPLEVAVTKTDVGDYPRLASKDRICESCVSLRIENKKLLAKVSLLELQIEKGVKSGPLPTGDSAEDLYVRNIAAKNARFQKIFRR